MKTKSLFSWNILLISLGCFLFTIHSSSGMFGEEFDKAQADEAAKLKAQQQAEQQQRGRESTDPDYQQVSGSSTAARGDLSSGGPSEKTPDETAKDEAIRNAIKSYFGLLPQEQENALVDEVDGRVEKYELSLMRFDDPPLTEEERIRLINEIITSIDARNKAAQQQIIQRVAVTHLVAVLTQEQQHEQQLIQKKVSVPRHPLDSLPAAAVLFPEKSSTPSWSLPPPTAAILAVTQPHSPSEETKRLSVSSRENVAPVLLQQLLPPQESAFTKQKNESLRSLREQIATAQREIPTHQATQDRLQKESAAHEGRVRQANLDLENFKAINPLTGSGLRFGFTEHSRNLLDQKDRLETAYNNAIRAKNQFAATTRNQWDSAKSSVATLSSRIQSLEQQHARVAASEDPVIVEKRRQEEAVASAARLEQQRQRQQQEAATRALTREQRRQQEIAEGKIEGLAQRKKIEAQLAAEREKALASAYSASEEAKRHSLSSLESTLSSSPPSTPPGNKGSANSSPEQLLAKRLSEYSNGSTSEEGSNHSTPEKIMAPLLMTEIKQLEEGVRNIHAAVGVVWKTIKESETALLREYNAYSDEFKQRWIDARNEFQQGWTHYFDLAEKRSQLKQRLATLKGNGSELIFNRSVKDALFTRYNEALFERDRFFGDLYRTSFGSKFADIYDRHSIHSMDDYHRNAEVQELEQPVIKDLQETRQQVALQLLQAELALVAAEERPPILQQIEACVWQNMPEFSEEDRKRAVRRAYDSHLNRLAEERIALKYDRSGSAASSSSSYSDPYNTTQRSYLAGRQNLMNQQYQASMAQLHYLK